MIKEKLLQKSPLIPIVTKDGIELFVRKLNAEESAEYMFMGMKPGASVGGFEMEIKTFKRRDQWLVSKVIVDEAGKRCLSDIDASQIESDVFDDLVKLIQEKLNLNVKAAVDEEKKD